MVSRVTAQNKILSLREVAECHIDTEAALRRYFHHVPDNPVLFARFTGYTLGELASELTERVDETDLRSALAILSRIEAAFRVDYAERLKRKSPDEISIAFRRLSDSYRMRFPLEAEIFEIWRGLDPGISKLISDLKGAFKFRHWYVAVLPAT